jgi:hypothetical protein
MMQVLVAALIIGYVWFTLWTNGAPGWPALVVTLPFLVGFAYRTWTTSATLTTDTLIIRNVLSTERVALADITALSRDNRRRMLRVTDRRGETYRVAALQYDQMAWTSGLRCGADKAADLIAAAAGLPPLPPRKEKLSKGQAWLLLVGGLALAGVGFYFGLFQIFTSDTHRNANVAAYEPLWGIGVATLGFGIRAVIGHRRRTRRPPAPNSEAKDA